MSRRGIRAALLAVPLLLGLGLVLQALWIPLKAEVAQLLLQRAWTQTQVAGAPVKPWPWADHYPVARLRSAEHRIDQVVLAGDEGNVLAFAPGENMKAREIETTARIISGHRDTHFRFLQQLKRGELLTLESGESSERYRIADIRVADARQMRIDPTQLADTLMLVTCYPFDALTAGGSQRYVVSAIRIHENGASGDML